MEFSEHKMAVIAGPTFLNMSAMVLVPYKLSNFLLLLLPYKT